MSASSKKTNENEKNNKTHSKPKLYHKTTNILVSVSEFRKKQIVALCEVGIAKNPTDFARDAIRNMIRDNKKLLPTNLVSANWEGRHKKE